MFDATTNTLTIGWDHAEGPVRQYKISYAPMTGDPITEFVSTLQKMFSWFLSSSCAFIVEYSWYDPPPKTNTTAAVSFIYTLKTRRSSHELHRCHNSFPPADVLGPDGDDGRAQVMKCLLWEQSRGSTLP